MIREAIAVVVRRDQEANSGVNFRANDRRFARGRRRRGAGYSRTGPESGSPAGGTRRVPPPASVFRSCWSEPAPSPSKLKRTSRRTTSCSSPSTLLCLAHDTPLRGGSGTSRLYEVSSIPRSTYPSESVLISRVARRDGRLEDAAALLGGRRWRSRSRRLPSFRRRCGPSLVWADRAPVRLRGVGLRAPDRRRCITRLVSALAGVLHPPSGPLHDLRDLLLDRHPECPKRHSGWRALSSRIATPLGSAGPLIA